MERLRPRGERRRWVFRSTCLWSTSWRALSPCLRVCDSLARPGVCVPAAMPRSYDTVSSRMKRFQTLPGSSPRLRRSENRRFRSGRLPCVCPSDNRNRGSRGFRGGPFSRRRKVPSHIASVFLHHPRAPPCFTLNPRRVRFALGQVRSELFDASGSRLWTSSPTDAARSSPSVGPHAPEGAVRAEIVGSSPNTSWSPVRGSRYGDTASRAPACAWAGPATHRPRAVSLLVCDACAPQREADPIVR